MMIENIQYVSSPISEKEGHLKAIERALEAGIRWIQLRMKDMEEAEMKTLAIECAALCKQYGAWFILNDHVALAKEIEADGVHLGKEDIDPAEARRILGEDKIIGSTANTFEDIEALAKKPIQYLGVGPFRHTTAKSNLSPILGLEGYKEILLKMSEKGIVIPLIAIGGIEAGDAEALSSIGVYGVAVSGVVNKAPNPEMVVYQFKESF